MAEQDIARPVVYLGEGQALARLMHQLLKNRAPFGQRASAPLSQARPCASSLTGPSLAPRPERGSFGPVWLLFSCWRQYL